MQHDELDAVEHEPDVAGAASRVIVERLTAARRSELDDGGAELRAFAKRKGHELVLVESSPTSCTARAARDPIFYRPAVVTVTIDDVERARLDKDPIWIADPQRFLAAWATR